jgi:AraC family transcriptional regulator
LVDASFFETIAYQMGVPDLAFKPPVAVFFSFDSHLEALCRLLMEETGNDGPRGPLYFEAMANVVAVSLLGRLCDQAAAEPHPAAVPLGIWRAVQWIEENFATKVSIEKLAVQAGLSPRHFARSFLQATGYTPHAYLLRIRLGRALELLKQPGRAKGLKEIAVSCGFFDQTHFGRHFRRMFGTTPAVFARVQQRLSASSRFLE